MLTIGEIEYKELDIVVNNVRLRVLTAGPEDAKPVLCLHGFPDTPHTFIYQTPKLIEAGFRVVIPFLRGYPPSESGAFVDCFPVRLGEDAIALIDELCGGKAYLLAHDWGAVAAYIAAQLAPEKIERMVVCAIPPIPAFENAKVGLKQAWRSRYIFLFQVAPLANRMMRARNLAGLDYLWSYWSPTWHYSAADIAPLKECLSQPGAMEAATRYYRAACWGSIKDRSLGDLLNKPTSVTTLVCAGQNDGCIGIEAFADVGNAFTGEWAIETIPGAGHFMHHEKPEAFNQVMMDFFS